MENSQLLKLIEALMAARNNDLDARDNIVRILSGRIAIQGQIIGSLLDIQRDGLPGDDAKLDELATANAAATKVDAALDRILNHGQVERDQLAAAIAEFSEIAARSGEDG